MRDRSIHEPPLEIWLGRGILNRGERRKKKKEGEEERRS